MKLVDIHAHLTDARYGESQAEIVEKFCAEGGKIIIDAGYDKRSSQGAFDNSKKFDCVYSVVGIHPEKPCEFDEAELQTLKNFSTHPKCVGIGEIGLDYHYEGFDKSLQKQAFEAQIELADQLQLPFVVHSRDASKDCLDVLKGMKKHINNGFLMHCYSESREMVNNYLDLGAYFSFGGVTTFKNAKKDEIIQAVPLDRVLTETDSPYLTPSPFRGQTNYPYLVGYVLEKLASVYNIDTNQLADKILENSKDLFFKLPKTI